jgi:hypothetical protein
MASALDNLEARFERITVNDENDERQIEASTTTYHKSKVSRAAMLVLVWS